MEKENESRTAIPAHNWQAQGPDKERNPLRLIGAVLFLCFIYNKRAPTSASEAFGGLSVAGWLVLLINC
jgi:hypothetical protein